MVRAFTCLLLLSAPLAGCGPGVPGEFQVSGKPIEQWLTAIRDTNSQTRLKAVRALGNVGPHHPQAIPALTGALADSDAVVRAQAALALLKSGHKGNTAIPALETALQDADPNVRQCAQQALDRIAGKP